jgi:magnesium-transporting ATPase (P-type)
LKVDDTSFVSTSHLNATALQQDHHSAGPLSGATTSKIEKKLTHSNSLGSGAFKKIKLFFGHKADKPKEQVKKPNSVRTTKFSFYSWAPLSLLFQFKRAANIYFLVISVLTCLPFSPKNPTSMIGTFAIVLIFTMLKELYEDIQRYKSDKELNTRKTNVLLPSGGMKQSETKMWSEVKVGDIVKVDKDCEFPADLLLIHAPNAKDLVFVDTMNLDGETNLKERFVFSREHSDTLQRASELYGELVCDPPHESLDDWDGNVHFPDGHVVNSK